MINDTYENNISRITFYGGKELTEINSVIKTKIKNKKTYLVYGTSRFETIDTSIIYKKIKNEKLLLKLNNGEEYVLENCNG